MTFIEPKSFPLVGLVANTLVLVAIVTVSPLMAVILTGMAAGTALPLRPNWSARSWDIRVVEAPESMMALVFTILDDFFLAMEMGAVNMEKAGLPATSNSTALLWICI